MARAVQLFTATTLVLIVGLTLNAHPEIRLCTVHQQTPKLARKDHRDRNRSTEQHHRPCQPRTTSDQAKPPTLQPPIVTYMQEQLPRMPPSPMQLSPTPAVARTSVRTVPKMTRTTTQTARTTFRLHGAKRVWCWRMTTYELQWTGSTLCTDRSYNNDAYQGGVKQDVLEACEGKRMDATGQHCRRKPGSALQVTDSERGRPTSSRLFTTAAPGTGRQQKPKEQGDHARPDTTREAWTLCRPRCYRTAFFQRPGHLHPYAPSCRRRHKHRPKLAPPSSPKPIHRKSLSRADAKLPSYADTDAAGASDTQPNPKDPSLRTYPRRASTALRYSRRPARRSSLSPTDGRPGPKSGTGFRYICYFLSIMETGGVRVPPVTTTGGRLASAPAGAGKHRGTARTTASAPQPTSIPQTHILKTAKRAFRRARNRANASAEQGTWYKGKWHTAASLGRLPLPEPLQTRRSRKPRARGTAQAVRHLRILSWNTSGLSSPLFQEFLAWCELNAQYDAIVLQETHWPETGDFNTGPWLAMHSSGRQSPDGHGRSAGLLCLLHRHTFQDPRIQELSPGRLALVQATIKSTGLPISLIGIYQHV